ncbi:NAD(P)H-binding protein [Cuniculiplasma sp. SKW3]|uniref:NAD(P)H-binding protein n=1 Tax=Cuniculiplasma sp. SKW3 TaxID=3400170 RepID=UPI003FD1B427
MTANLHKDESSHLVIGATGGYGYAITRLLLERNYNVKLAVRDVNKAKLLFGENLEVDQVDVLNAESIKSATNKIDYVYVAFNFPYNQWFKYEIAMSHIISAARLNKSTIIFPGNVYGYGKFKKIPFDETHPLSSDTIKGRIRNEIEAKLKKNFIDGKIGLILPRFADFYGPNVTNDLFGAMFKDAMKNKFVKWIINPDVLHSFTYIEDAARPTLLMVENDDMGEVYHISSNAITGREFISKIFSHLGKSPKIRVYKEWELRLYSFINSQVREVLELSYEFEEPYVMSSEKFSSRYSDFKFADYDLGIEKTLNWFKKYSIDHF